MRRCFGLWIGAFLSVLVWVLPVSAHAERIEDLARVEGVTDNPLVGYGLVVGLPGTGDSTMSPFTRRSLESALSRLGVNVRDLDQKIQGRNVAAVFLTANLAPFSRTGTRFSVRVASIGDALSLAGGTLLLSELKGPDGKVYATSQGAVNTLTSDPVGFSAAKGDPIGGRRTTGTVSGGGLVVRNVQVDFNGRKHLWINLDRSNFTTATRIARAINATFSGRISRAIDAGTVDVQIPESSQDDVVGFMARILNLRVTPDRLPLVVINQQTGTIVIGRGVKVSPCAVSQKDLTVQVGAKGKKGGRSGGQSLQLVARSVTLRSVVRALNLLGTRTEDLIAILEALKEAGALQATIRVVG